MKFFSAISKGALKSIKTIKLVIITWLITFLLVWPASLVLKSSFNPIFGKSMMPESLLRGFDAGITADITGKLSPFIHSLTFTTFFVIMGGALLNLFFEGGFFGCYTSSEEKHNVPDFFSSSARFFLPFMGVTVMVMLMILGTGLLLTGAPLLIAGTPSMGGETSFLIIRISVIIWILTLPVFLLVADHARVWMASHGSHKVFNAMGAGFRNAFRHFLRGYLSVLIIMAASALITLITVLIFKDAIPERGIIIFILFLAVQAIAVTRTWIRCWRYAAVSELARDNAVI